METIRIRCLFLMSPIGASLGRKSNAPLILAAVNSFTANAKIPNMCELEFAMPKQAVVFNGQEVGIVVPEENR
jgi:hypothetical protein